MKSAWGKVFLRDRHCSGWMTGYPSIVHTNTSKRNLALHAFGMCDFFGKIPHENNVLYPAKVIVSVRVVPHIRAAEILNGSKIGFSSTTLRQILGLTTCFFRVTSVRKHRIAFCFRIH